MQAMGLLHSGKAGSKKDAAALAGTHQTSLKPQRLSALIAANPALSGLIRSSPLDLTADVTRDGKTCRVSMREALSEGATNCVRVIAELAPLIGKLTKEQERTYQQASRWLTMCKQIGLFGDNEGATLPGELQHLGETTTKGVEWWRAHHNRQDMGARMITVIPSPSENPVEAEGQASAGKV
jgi:hypothetical protein